MPMVSAGGGGRCLLRAWAVGWRGAAASGGREQWQISGSRTKASRDTETGEMVFRRMGARSQYGWRKTRVGGGRVGVGRQDGGG